MATKKTKSADSNFFSFAKVGDKITGKITGFSTSQYGLIIELDGKKLISANKTQLMNIIKDNRKAFVSGKTLTISFVDEKKVKGQKNKVKIFTVLVGGKELKSAQSFQRFDSISDKSFDILFS